MARFIVFEGLDGSGLSTQSSLLQKHLSQKGEKTLLTKEQTDGLVGGLIKSRLRGEWETTPLTLQLLFAADRSHHLSETIEPALGAGKTVICDRYILSSLAYGSLEVDLDFLKKINSKFREPDLTLILDLPPEVCLERIKKARNGLELFEQKEKMGKIRENYHSLKNYFPNTHLIDGDRPVEEVFQEVKEIFDRSRRS